MDHGHPISYQALRRGTDVYSGDGQRLGVVQRVVADARTHIFRDLVIDTRLGPGGLKVVHPADIADIYERAVVLKLGADDIDGLPAP